MTADPTAETRSRRAGTLDGRDPDRVAPRRARRRCARQPSSGESPVITATDLELRAGSRILLSDATLRVQPGDRIGLVGRNGAGKTTTMRVLAGEGEPYAGTRHRERARSATCRRTPARATSPSAPRTGCSRRAASTSCSRELEKAQAAMAELVDGAQNERAVREYGRIEERFAALGGYAAESDAARICANLGLPERVLDQRIATLSGGQRRRVELARILFAASDGGGGGAPSATTLLLDEPTNHLDADSITWLRSFLSAHTGGLVVISHDTELLAAVVNKVWFLDAVRGEVDVYNMDWHKLPGGAGHRREAPPPRARQRREEGRRRCALQAAKMGAKATKAVAAKNMARRADQMLAALEPERVDDKVARIRFPNPAPCGRTPLTAEGLSKAYGSLEVFTGVDLAVDRGAKVVVLGPERRGQDHAAAPARRRRDPRRGRGRRRARAADRLLRAGARHARHGRDGVGERPPRRAGHRREQQLRTLLGAFMFSGAQLDQPAGTLSGGEQTRLALAGLVSSAANVLLLDEPTNNLDPASREQVLDALRQLRGRGRAGHPRPRRRRGAHAGQGHRAAGRHRGPLVGRLPGPRPAGLIGRSSRDRCHPIAVAV